MGLLALGDMELGGISELSSQSQGLYVPVFFLQFLKLFHDFKSSPEVDQAIFTNTYNCSCFLLVSTSL